MLVVLRAGFYAPQFPAAGLKQFQVFFQGYARGGDVGPGLLQSQGQVAQLMGKFVSGVGFFLAGALQEKAMACSRGSTGTGWVLARAPQLGLREVTNTLPLPPGR